jgi:hypothetical protein
MLRSRILFESAGVFFSSVSYPLLDPSGKEKPTHSSAFSPDPSSSGNIPRSFRFMLDDFLLVIVG